MTTLQVDELWTKDLEHFVRSQWVMWWQYGDVELARVLFVATANKASSTRKFVAHFSRTHVASIPQKVSDVKHRETCRGNVEYTLVDRPERKYYLSGQNNHRFDVVQIYFFELISKFFGKNSLAGYFLVI